MCLVGSFFWFYLNLKIVKNELEFTVYDADLEHEQTLKIALIADIHIPDTNSAYEKIDTLLNEIKAYKPDLYVFAGDYTSLPSSLKSVELHRSKIVEILTKEELEKKIFVLGNYETWTDASEWNNAFLLKTENILNNKTAIVAAGKTKVCVRGLGDFYTNQFKYLDFPKACEGLIKFSVTHDPAGAFVEGMKGLILSGHTHCGQIKLPFYGSIWIPSNAPLQATCGLYKDKKRTVFTTAGAGTSILPIRIGTQSNWDLLKIKFVKTNKF